MGGIEMDATLSKSFIEKTKEAANKRAIKQYDDENDDGLLYEGLKHSVEEMTIEDNCIKVGIDVKDLGWINLDIPLTVEDLTDIIELSVKKLNKFKTALEVLK